MLRFTLAIAALFLLQAPQAAAMPENFSVSKSWQLLAEKPDVYLLDVRTLGEYMQVRIDGAKLIPIDQVVGRLDEIPRGKPILVYCAVGSRSSQVARYLDQQGYSQVYNMYGGIWAWQSRGYPVMTGPP